MATWGHCLGHVHPEGKHRPLFVPWSFSSCAGDYETVVNGGGRVGESSRRFAFEPAPPGLHPPRAAARPGLQGDCAQTQPSEIGEYGAHLFGARILELHATCSLRLVLAPRGRFGARILELHATWSLRLVPRPRSGRAVQG